MRAVNEDDGDEEHERLEDETHPRDRDEGQDEDEPEVRPRAKKPRTKKPPAQRLRPGEELVQPSPKTPAEGEALSVRVTRVELPDGFRVDAEDVRLFRGEAGWCNSHDLKYIQEHIEGQWGGGLYKVEFFSGLGDRRVPIGRATTVTVPGDPKVLREPLPAPAPAKTFVAPGGGFHPGGGFQPGGFQQQPHGFQQPPFHQQPHVGFQGGFFPPRGASDDRVTDLEEELARMRRERERKEDEERLLKLIEAKIPKTPAIDPMQQYLQIMERQAAEERSRREAEERRREAERKEEQAKRDAEERRRAEERKEEREEQRHREEKAERERKEERDKEEARRREDREREEKRMDREEARRREDEKARFDWMDRIFSAKQRDPVDDLLRLTEAQQAIRDATPGAKTDEPEGVVQQVVEGVTGLARGVGDYLSARAEEKTDAVEEKRQPIDGGKLQGETVQPQAAGALPGPARPAAPRAAPAAPPPPAPTENQYGTFARMFEVAVLCKRNGLSPEQAAVELKTAVAIWTRDGNKHAAPALNELTTGGLGAASQVEILTALGMLKMSLTNGRLQGVVAEVENTVKTPEGLAWLKAMLAALGGGAA